MAEQSTLNRIIRRARYFYLKQSNLIVSSLRISQTPHPFSPHHPPTPHHLTSPRPLPFRITSPLPPPLISPHPPPHTHPSTHITLNPSPPAHITWVWYFLELAFCYWPNKWWWKVLIHILSILLIENSKKDELCFWCDELYQSILFNIFIYIT